MFFETTLSSSVTSHSGASSESMTLDDMTASSHPLNTLVLYKAEKKVIKFHEGHLVKDVAGNPVELATPITVKKVQVVFSTFVDGKEVDRQVQSSLPLKESILSRLKIEVKDGNFLSDIESKVEKFSCELQLTELTEPTLFVTLPESTDDAISYSFEVEEVDSTEFEKIPMSSIPYNHLHHEVIAFYHVFISSCMHSKNYNFQDLKFVLYTAIPHLLYARDILIALHEKNPNTTSELKMSGKKGKDQCRFLSFSRESEATQRYGSVKILPNGQVYFHLTKNMVKGFYKKATFKIASTIEQRDKFVAFAKIAPLTHRKNPKDAAAIAADWEKLMLFKHPNIASIHTLVKEKVATADGELELIKVYNPVTQDFFEYLAELDRLSLKFKTQKEVFDTLTHLLEILFGVADGLQHLHLRGYVYQDLKPENILIDQTGPTLCAKLSDFGLLKTFEELDNSESTSSDRYKGTGAYMISGAKKSIYSDFYAYGMTVNFIIRYLIKLESRTLSNVFMGSYEGVRISMFIGKFIKELKILAHRLTHQVTDPFTGKQTYGNNTVGYKQIIDSLYRVKFSVNC
jgi:hypothetical protein